MSDTFAGIRLIDVPGFIGAQLLGAFAATALFRWLTPPLSNNADVLVVPKESGKEHGSERPTL
jgi:glycerol uptake facilitator-like aquaporin